VDVPGIAAIPGGRAVVSDTPAGLAITIPARPNRFMLVFVGVWLVGWAAGEWVVLRKVATAQTLDYATLFLIVWLAGWTVGGVVAARSWLWSAFGKERIVLGPATLSMKRDVLGMGRERRYDLPLISNLRTVPVVSSGRVRSARTPERSGTGRANVAFDYGPGTVYFGGGLDEAEASFIVERLKTRHGFR
jgi:hypothetical protein